MDNEKYRVFHKIVEGFRDYAEGKYIVSTGDWEKDKKLFAEKEANGWK